MTRLRVAAVAARVNRLVNAGSDPNRSTSRRLTLPQACNKLLIVVRMRESSPVKWRSGGYARILLLVVVVLIGSERQARAYTDPGTGAMIWQMLVAGFLGAAFYFRRFTTWFKNKGRKD